jgi:hypothetical protein
MSNGMQRRDFIRSTGFVAGAAAAASLMEAGQHLAAFWKVPICDFG